jgi:hypothetical protein
MIGNREKGQEVPNRLKYTDGEKMNYRFICKEGVY